VQLVRLTLHLVSVMLTGAYSHSLQWRFEEVQDIVSATAPRKDGVPSQPYPVHLANRMVLPTLAFPRGKVPRGTRAGSSGRYSS